MFYKNNTQASMVAKFTEPEDYQYLCMLAHKSQGEEKQQRKEIVEFHDIRQAKKNSPEGGLYTAPHDLPDSVGFHRSLLESTRLVTQTFSVSHRPSWQVQSGVVRRNMPCSGGLPGFGPDFSANQVHWTSVATALAGVFAISVNKICKIMEIFE